MKRLALAAILIISAVPVAALAGGPVPWGGAGSVESDGLSGLLQLSATKGSVPEHPKSAIIRYLDLSDAQIEAWDALIEETSTFAEPLRDRVQEIDDELAALFESDDTDAGTVGGLVIERHGLLEELFRLRRDYVDRFEHGILTVDQHRKYHVVRAAARVQPLIPAFRLFALIPPR